LPWVAATGQFNGANVADFRLPSSLPLSCAKRLDALAQSLASRSPSGIAEREPSRNALDTARAESGRIRAEMIAELEDLDWECHRLYGLVGEDLTYCGDDLPGIALGERTFELVLARAVDAGAGGGDGAVHPPRLPPRSPRCRRTGPPTIAPSCSAVSTSSPRRRRSACWSGRSTRGAGRASRGRSGRSGPYGSGCWTGWRAGGSGSTRRVGRARGRWANSAMRWPAPAT